MTPAYEILVVGAGAMGGVYAAHGAGAAKVTVLDANAAHIGAIRAGGLRLSGVAERCARLEAFTAPEELHGRAFDAVLLLVKSQVTLQAFESLQPHLAGSPLLVSFQNGMGNVEALMGASDWDIAHGVTFEAGRYIAPGHIEHFIHGEEAWMGPARGPMPRVERLGEVFCAAGLPTRVVQDPRGAIWAKFLFNCVMNPIGALVMGENRARYEVPEMGELIDEAFAEGMAVAKAAGIALPYDPMHLVKRIRAGAAPLTRHAGSMATDIAAGRETELEFLTGYLVRKADALGVPAPATRTVYRLAKGLDYASRLRSREAGAAAGR
jgi:2-dehydropantoate 2-reductase